MGHLRSRNSVEHGGSKIGPSVKFGPLMPDRNALRESVLECSQMANGDFSDHDGFGKTGRLVLTSSSRAWDSRFLSDRLPLVFKRVRSPRGPQDPPGDLPGAPKIPQEPPSPPQAPRKSPLRDSSRLPQALPGIPRAPQDLTNSLQ